MGRTFLNESITRAKKQKWKTEMFTKKKVGFCI